MECQQTIDNLQITEEKDAYRVKEKDKSYSKDADTARVKDICRCRWLYSFNT